MLDVLLLASTIGFFLLGLEYAIGIVLSILLTGYLGYALIRPERF